MLKSIGIGHWWASLLRRVVGGLGAVAPVALMIMAGSLGVGQSAIAAQPRNVLMLFGNNRVLPANIEVDRGFRETIANSVERSVDLFAEFLDRPAFSGPTLEQVFATYLRDKYAARRPDVIVVVGGPALDFVLRHRAGLFPDVAVVHLGVDQSYLRTIPALPADVIGVPVVYDFAGTIQQALRWHPQARRLVLVTGDSAGDRAWESDLRAALARVGPEPALEYLAGLSTDAVLKRLSELGDGDVVFTPGYFRDGSGREFAPRDVVTRMAAASGAPVYGPFSTFIGSGVVGGLMPTFVEMGRQAARDVNGLLGGMAPAALRMPASIAAQMQVDWRQVRKWGIDEGAIPTDAIVHFRVPTFWEANRQRVLVVAAVIFLQAVLIAALLVERRLRRRTASALVQSETRLNLAARAARLSIWIWDITRDKLWTTNQAAQPAGTSLPPPIAFGQILESVHPSDREGLDRAVRQAVANDEELDVEVRMLQPGGEGCAGSPRAAGRRTVTVSA